MSEERAKALWTYEDILAGAEVDHGAAGVLEATKQLCLADLFFLLVHVLGRADMNRDWLFDRCREVENDPDGHLDLWARDHYKSTIITFGLTIQGVLKDPEITVGIFSHTRPIAKGFLVQIKREFEQNVRLKELFPDVLWQNPAREAPKWSEDDGIIVKRAGNPKESTIEAWGLVDGQPTSRHYKLMVFDDVVTRESVTTVDQIKKVTGALELAQNLSSSGGRKRYIGTRYHFRDTYGTIIERESAKPRIYPATDNGREDGVPVLLTMEELKEKRRDMGPYTFGCQMLQNPRADMVQGFDESWLRRWAVKSEHWERMNRYIIVDPANEKKEDSDYTTLWVVGCNSDRCFYVIDGFRDRLNLSERTKRLFKFHRKYKPLMVVYEQYGMQSDIQHIEYVMDAEGYHFAISKIGGNVPKLDRIRRLVPVFEQGRIYLPQQCHFSDYEGRLQDLTTLFIREEYGGFPVCVHDDMLDALARLEDPAMNIVFPAEEDAVVYTEAIDDTPLFWADRRATG